MNCFSNFQVDEKHNKHEMSCRNQDHAELEIFEKIRTFLNKEIAEMEKASENVSKHSLLNKSLQASFMLFMTFR